MKASLRFDVEPGCREAVEPALNQESFKVNETDSGLEVTVEEDSIGRLRGATDSVFRLVSLWNSLR